MKKVITLAVLALILSSFRQVPTNGNTCFVRYNVCTYFAELQHQNAIENANGDHDKLVSANDRFVRSVQGCVQELGTCFAED